MTTLSIAVIVLRLITLILAGMILRKSFLRYKQFRSYDPSSKNAFLLFGIGIFVFSLGEILEELLFELTEIGLSNLHIIESSLNVLGFAIIIYSIYRS